MTELCGTREGRSHLEPSHCTRLNGHPEPCSTVPVTADNPHGYIFAERGSFEWNAAWQELMAVGHRPEDFMLMHGEPKGSTVTWGFKHIDNRNYVYITIEA